MNLWGRKVTRLILKISPKNEMMILPLKYNHIIQGFIYENISGSLASWLHDQGESFNRRRFKLFTFSRLLGRYKISNGDIIFKGPLELHISSVHERILKSLATHLLHKEWLKFGREYCKLDGIEVQNPVFDNTHIKVRALSPIVVYSTLEKGDGKRKTYYYSPFEDDWKEQILLNLERKASALGWNLCLDHTDHFVKPLKVSNRDLKIIEYKGTIIKGWTGLYELELPKPFLNLAYDAGLGSKNSQGFGCIDPLIGNKNAEKVSMET